MATHESPSGMSRGPLPTGSVTFFFSDIEGSTRLLQELGAEAYEEAQDVQMAIMRDAIALGGGREIRTEGDSFFVVFPTAEGAVAASVSAQRKLPAHPWPHNRRLLVRMGLHTGEGRLGGDDYVGLDVNRAARIAAAGHGGQVLLSDATRALIATHVPDGVRIQTLGSYRLKDLPVPERIYQLEIKDLPASFPPLRALDVRRAHLPPESTTFIGRGAELDAVADLLGKRRLVTLTGPGGTGKTRLALRAGMGVADRFADGAFFVAMATVDDPGFVPTAIASSLNLPEDPARPIREVLEDWLGDRKLLLVVDNLEQIEDAGPVLGGLLEKAPGLHVLATSRSPLRVAGEQEFPVPPFAVPALGAESATLAASEAVRLFVDRARLLRPDFTPTEKDLTVIAEVCRRLDGLPLAIELAAARVRIMSPASIRDRLGRRLDALVGGPATAPKRQRSLRGTISWSHDLLDEPGRALFRRLAVFLGGWTFEAANTVTAGPPVEDIDHALESLAAQSLIQSSALGDEPRFTMLATIGEFALEQLEASPEAAEYRRRHGDFFRQLAEEGQRQADGADREIWFDRLEGDLDNLRAAIERARAEGDLDQALGIAAALRAFWLQRNHTAEGVGILRSLIAERGEPAGREFAAATAAAAAIVVWLGDYATGRRMGELSVAAYRRIGDRWGLAEALGSLAFATIEVDPTEAISLNDECLGIYRELGDIRGQGQTLLGRATVQFAMGHVVETRTLLERSLALLRQAGDHYFELFASVFLSRIQLLMGDAAAGMSGYHSVLETSRALDLRLGVAIGLDFVAEVAIWGGDVARAVRLGAAAERLKEELGGGIPPRIGGAPDPLAVGRTELSPAEFEREAAAGRAMGLDTAIAEALAAGTTVSVPPLRDPSPSA